MRDTSPNSVGFEDCFFARAYIHPFPLSRVRQLSLYSTRTTRVRFSYRRFQPCRAGLDIPVPARTPDPRLNIFYHGRGWWQADPGCGPSRLGAKDGAQRWSRVLRKSSEAAAGTGFVVPLAILDSGTNHLYVNRVNPEFIYSAHAHWLQTWNHTRNTKYELMCNEWIDYS